MNDDAGSDLPIRFDILTLFPEMFPPVLETSIPGRAAKANAAEYAIHDLRDWAEPGGHRKVDDRPFGGGPGMVLMCQPIHDAVCAVEKLDKRKARRIVLSPQGRPLDQRLLEELANESRLLLIAGHYEGIDERVVEHLELEEISLGDFVLSGGELGALVLVDGIARLQPGVLGHSDSAQEDSFSPVSEADERRLLDCPHYTRPRVWEGREVPEVLLSGDHHKIAQWRLRQREERTQQRRPDLSDNR